MNKSFFGPSKYCCIFQCINTICTTFFNSKTLKFVESTMLKKNLPFVAFTLIFFTLPLFAEIKSGSRIECKKEGSSRYSSGKVLWSNNRLVGVRFNDGDRKTVNKNRCRLNSTRPATTTNNANSKFVTLGGHKPRVLRYSRVLMALSNAVGKNSSCS